jgi:hypothetical protein
MTIPGELTVTIPTAGAPSNTAAPELWTCPQADYTFTRSTPGETIPQCPTHRRDLARGTDTILQG